jgi:RHS repeat-associated protein
VGSNTYAWDFENHLKSMNGVEVTIISDGEGNRVVKTAGATTTKSLVDDRNLTGYAQVLEEIVGGAVQRVYTYGLNRISQSQASATSFYGYDGHGSVRLLTDTTGTVTDRYDYDAFGNIVGEGGTTPNVYLYSGEQNDTDIGAYYLRARYLMPNVGRFLTTDTSPGDPESPISFHQYLFAAADPVALVDPSGKSSILDAVAADLLNSFDTLGNVFRPSPSVERGLLGFIKRVVGQPWVLDLQDIFKWHGSGLVGSCGTNANVGECATFVQVAVAEATHEEMGLTDTWEFGYRSVLSNQALVPGTVIATRDPSTGRYPAAGSSIPRHAAFYLGQHGDEIDVFDQYNASPPNYFAHPPGRSTKRPPNSEDYYPVLRP